MKKLIITKEDWAKVTSLRDEVFKEIYNIDPYDYQKKISNKIIRAVLLNTGETIPVVQARQSGKTAAITLTITFLLTFYFQLKKALNLWYFSDEFAIGIFAPQQEQAKTDFVRIKQYLEMVRDKSPDFEIVESNGNTLTLKSQTFPKRVVYCFSASPTSRTESKTLHLIILEESQDLLDSKVNNTILPMGTNTNAVTVYVGTTGYKRCNFYRILVNSPEGEVVEVTYRRAIKERRKKFNETKNPIHLSYEKRIKNIIKELGEDSDAFRTQYALQWVLERGQFITEQELYKLENKDELPVFMGKALPCYIGIDWGKHKDSTVMTVVDENYNIRAWLEMQGDDYNSQILMIVKSLQTLFLGCKAIYCDSTGNQDQAVDVLRAKLQESKIFAAVTPVVFTQSSKDAMFKNLWSLMHDKTMPNPAGGVIVIEPSKLTYPKGSCVEKDKFLTQFLNLQKEIKGGMWACHHPEGNYHDDFCASLALACMSFNKAKKAYTPCLA